MGNVGIWRDMKIRNIYMNLIIYTYIHILKKTKKINEINFKYFKSLWKCFPLCQVYYRNSINAVCFSHKICTEYKRN